MAFEKKFYLFFFLRSLAVYKNHVCEYYFPSTKNQAKISIPVHSVVGMTTVFPLASIVLYR